MTGMSSARQGRLQAAIEADVRARRYFGAVFAVARHGEAALCEAIGHADPGHSDLGPNGALNRTGDKPNELYRQLAGSTLFWVDPERELVFACLTAGVINEGANVERFQRLSDLVQAAAE